jgi:type II secretory pathway pseudopilin PulG
MIEVIVSLGILMVVVTALLPQLIVGIKSTGTARLVTQAKGVAQGELEKMRNLPYHISPEAGDFRDVLDFYYRNVAAPTMTPSCKTSGGYAVPETSWSGYVSATGTRCDYEPSGAFYRRVSEVPTAVAGAKFTVVVATQFLSGGTPPQPVTPTSGYDTQTISGSRPAASQIGVTVTVLYSDRTTVRPVSTYTQISDRPTTTTRVRAEANITAVEVGSVTTGNGPVSLSAGLLKLAGSLTYASTVNANLAATSAGLATGEQASGASRTVAAPPTSSTEVVNAVAGSLATTGCDIACWGATKLDVAPLSAAAGLPQAGSPTAPMQSLLTDTTVNNGISFGNSSADLYRAGLKLTPPLLRMHSAGTATASGISAGCVPGGSGTSSYITAGGYLRTTAVNDSLAPSTVESCAVARTSSISLFPTDFAPNGIVVVELTHANARCMVQTAAHTPTVSYDYQAVVKYWDGAAYQTLTTIAPGMSGDPLEALDLSTTSVGDGKTLGTYIASWSALTSTEITQTASAGTAQLTLPGIITIASQPVRPDTNSADGLDATSVVSVAVGALGCLAEDRR